MTPSIIDLRTHRPVAVCAHKRARPYNEQYIATTQRLIEEVALNIAMDEWAEAFPDECLKDPVFQATGGLAL